MLSIAARQCVRTVGRHTNTYSFYARHNYLATSRNHVFLQGLLKKSSLHIQEVFFKLKLKLNKKKTICTQ